MKRKVMLSVALAASLGFGGTLGLPSEAFASKLSDLENQQSQIENKRSNIHNDIKEKNNKINQIQKEQDQITAEMEKIDSAVSDAESNIREKEQQISETKVEIEKLKGEIEQLKKRIAERKEVLRDRARSIQKNGGSASYLDVVLGADSFSDFIGRATAVTTLVNADKTIMEEQKRDQEKLEENQEKVENELHNLEKMLQELEMLKADLHKKKAEKDAIMKKLEKEEKSIEKDKLSLEEEENLLKSQEMAIKQAIQAEKNQAKPSYTAPGSSSRPSTPSQFSHDVPAVSSGTFTRPAAGRVSSGFGARDLGDHKGIDIANGVSVPIVAAADGVVIRSYYSSSYGNAIFISHSINGKVFTTVYAHMSQRVVQGGHVSKGQVIGYMGNTGQSYGQHLHFEIHEGPWNMAKSNAVNPTKYINF
ncbi:peptidoglycan hydrolase CwlO-like protein [Oikeobacillus pervagus]|uniref:Peptidoglycan hydrolase CwlO-like protein n=1 Tax=Oikeobacillus pervagus TaxID=1325931 RepID=A0AAJ1WIY3_9BACI|nr:peptidoglycan DD-metalloendopeptidase family protein [Oikeobacillus pervagus]MDQ0214893.1 peptidoglycan hydrolase CwlO-like protein [Oikeobacillus pervagus]